MPKNIKDGDFLWQDKDDGCGCGTEQLTDIFDMRIKAAQVAEDAVPGQFYFFIQRTAQSCFKTDQPGSIDRRPGNCAWFTALPEQGQRSSSRL